MAVITVSREYGSRGEEITQEVAKELGYSYFDKDILADVARIANTTEDEIRQYDEKDEHGLHTFLKKLFIAQPLVVAEFPYYYPPTMPLDWSIGPIENEQRFRSRERDGFFSSSCRRTPGGGMML